MITSIFEDWIADTFNPRRALIADEIEHKTHDHTLLQNRLISLQSSTYFTEVSDPKTIAEQIVSVLTKQSLTIPITKLTITGKTYECHVAKTYIDHVIKQLKDDITHLQNVPLSTVQAFFDNATLNNVTTQPLFNEIPAYRRRSHYRLLEELTKRIANYQWNKRKAIEEEEEEVDTSLHWLRDDRLVQKQVNQTIEQLKLVVTKDYEQQYLPAATTYGLKQKDKIKSLSYDMEITIQDFVNHFHGMYFRDIVMARTTDHTIKNAVTDAIRGSWKQLVTDIDTVSEKEFKELLIKQQSTLEYKAVEHTLDTGRAVTKGLWMFLIDHHHRVKQEYNEYVSSIRDYFDNVNEVLIRLDELFDDFKMEDVYFSLVKYQESRKFIQEEMTRDSISEAYRIMMKEMLKVMVPQSTLASLTYSHDWRRAVMNVDFSKYYHLSPRAEKWLQDEQIEVKAAEEALQPIVNKYQALSTIISKKLLDLNRLLERRSKEWIETKEITLREKLYEERIAKLDQTAGHIHFEWWMILLRQIPNRRHCKDELVIKMSKSMEESPRLVAWSEVQKCLFLLQWNCLVNQ